MGRILDPGRVFEDLAGNLLAGGTVTFYTSGTLTKKSTYADSALTIANSNPVTIDSDGRLAAEVFGTGSYTIRAVDANGALAWSEDDVSSHDAEGITYNHGGTSATNRTIEARLQDIVSVKDYGATGDGSTDDVAAIEAAITAAGTNGTVKFPSGTYICESDLNISVEGVTLDIPPRATIKFADSSNAGVRVDADNISIIGGGTIDSNGQNQTAGSGITAVARERLTVAGMTIKNARGRYISITRGGTGHRIYNNTLLLDSALGAVAYNGIFMLAEIVSASYVDVQILNNVIDFSAETGSTIANLLGIVTRGVESGGSSFFTNTKIMGNVVKFPVGHTSGNRPVGIECTINHINTTINDNTVVGGEIGISGGGLIRTWTIDGNAVQQPLDYGIEVAGGTQASRHGTINGNSIYCASNTQYGIRITDSSEIAIGSNEVRSPTTHGVSLLRSDYISVSGGQILLSDDSTIGVDVNACDVVSICGVAFRVTGSSCDGVNLTGTNSVIAITGCTANSTVARLWEVISGTTTDFMVSGNCAGGTTKFLNSGTVTDGRQVGNVGLADQDPIT